MLVALFGITNDALNLVVNLVVLFLVVLWLALVAWTYFDARRRLQDGFLVLCATVCSLIFPFVGTIVYSILRPPEFLEDKRERALEIRASELRVRQLEEQSCPNCEHPVERTFLRCPSCRARIKDPCETCGKPIDPRWTICPYCETPQRMPAPPERAAPKRRSRSSRSSAPPETVPARSPSRSGSRSSSSTAGRKPASRPDDDGAPSRTAPATEQAPQPSGDAARKPPSGEPARKSTSSRQSRSSSRTAQQRATTTRQPKRSSE
jgi:hypothetical protein